MTTIKYFDSIWLLLVDMQFASKGNILDADDPNMMCYGWIDVDTEMYWKILIQDARASLRLADEHSIKVLSSYFLNRRNAPIYSLLNDLPFLRRMWKLKAFW